MRRLSRTALVAALLCSAGGLAAAEETRSSMFMVGANPFVQPSSGPVVAGWGWDPWEDIKDTVKDVVDDLSDYLEDMADVPDTVIDVSGDLVADIANFTVRIKGPIQGALLDSYKGMIDHRPEWMVDPPWWVNELSRIYLGVSMDVINTGVTLGVAANSGNFAWNNATKALVLKTVLHEGLVRAKPGVKFLATSAAPEPTLSILIDSAVEYGFDRVEDMANDRISQAFKTGNPGEQAATAAVANGDPVAVEFQSGAILPSVVVANYITIGGATDGSLSVVVPLRGAQKPGYFVAVGGPVILKTGTVITGNTVIQCAPNAAGVSTAVKTRAEEIRAAAAASSEWIDNTIPAVISGAAGG